MRRRALLLLLLAVVGVSLARADELLFGPPTGGGVATIPFDATQAAGCVAWDGITMLTHPENPICAGGGGGGTQPTQTPWSCGAGYYVQGVGSTPACVVVPTPDGGGAPQPTQTPWACGAGNYVQGLASSPQCQVVPTPDGAGGVYPTPTSVAFRNQANTFTGAQTITGDLHDTTGNVDLNCTSSGCAVADLTSGDQIVFERGGLYGNMALHSLTGGVVVADRWHSDPAACPSGQFCTDTDVTGACVCAALPTATPTLSPTPTPTATLAAGNAIDLTAGVIDFDATELTNFTVSDGLSATASTTYNLSGSNDPVWTAQNAGFVLESSGIPVFKMDDTDIAAGGSPDWTQFINCSAGPACSYTMSHSITGGTSSDILAASNAGTVTLGSSATTAITLTTDGTGDGELVVPTNSIGTSELTTTGVTGAGTICTNCNVTYGVDGRITAASTGGAISFNAALYVDKTGTDSASCGALNAPCLTVCGALDVIRTAADNSSSKVYGVRVGAGQFIETLAAGQRCLGGANGNTACTVASQCPGGTCNNDCSIPAPGYINIIGVTEGATQIADFDSSHYTVDMTGLTSVSLVDLSAGKVANSKAAVGSDGNATLIGLYNVGLQHTADDYDLDIKGAGNHTWTVKNVTTFGSGVSASAKSIHVESYPQTCSIDTTRPCASNGDCTAGSGGTCTTTTASYDFDFQHIFIQPGTQSSDPAVLWSAKHCGFKFNEFMRDIYIVPANVVESGGASRTGVKLIEDDCPTTNTTVGLLHNMTIRMDNITIQGDNANTSDPDVTLNVAANTTARVEGPMNFDKCKRTIAGTLLYAEPATGTSDKFGGAATDLGVLTCTAPPNPVNGECWYDRDTDARRECRVNGSTVGMLTSDNLSQYDYVSCHLSDSTACASLSASSDTTILTGSSSWDNTSKNTTIHAEAQVRSTSGLREWKCRLKSAVGTVIERVVTTGSSTDYSNLVTFDYLETATGTRGPYVLTCALTGTTSGTNEVLSASLSRVTSNVASLATVSSQIADWLSDETGTGALVFGTSPSLTTAQLTTTTLIGDTTVRGRAIIGPTVTPTATSAVATATATATVTPTPTATSVAATPTQTGATLTPTPSASPTPGLLVNGVSVTGCTCYTAFGPSTSPYAVRGGTSATQNMAFTAPAAPIAVGRLRCFLDRDVGFGAEFNCQVEKAALASMTATADGAATAMTWIKQSVPRCYVHGTNAGGEWRCDQGARSATFTDGWVMVDPSEAYHIRADVTVLSNYTVNWCECPLGALQ